MNKNRKERSKLVKQCLNQFKHTGFVEYNESGIFGDFEPLSYEKLFKSETMTVSVSIDILTGVEMSSGREYQPNTYDGYISVKYGNMYVAKNFPEIDVETFHVNGMEELLKLVELIKQ